MATEVTRTPSKRLWHVLQAMYYLFSKHNWFSLDFHLLFKRSRLAAKSLKRLTHHHSPTLHAKDYMSVLTCRYMDPSKAVYVPREVEFSCSNTPSFPSLYKTKHKLFRRNDYAVYRNESNDDELINGTKIFEILDMEYSDEEEDDVSVVERSPSPWINWRTPVGVRQLRVSDSPFLNEIDEGLGGGGGGGGGVDMEAEEFITRFREQLREQQLIGTGLEKRRYLK